MSTIPQQIQALKNNITSLRAMINGVRDQGKLYAITGDYVVFGCKVTQGTSGTDMYLSLDGQAIGDESHLNPDIQAVPLRHEEYPNIALIYGEVFEMVNVNKTDTASDSLLLDDAPGTANFGRYDLVYAYVGQAGPAVAILTGTASTAVKTDFTANGLDDAPYPSAFDPTLPHGTFPLARVYVQTGDTGIANARIADIRNFKGRMNPLATIGKFLAHTGNGLASTNTASRRFVTIIQNDCPGIVYSDSPTLGNKFTCTQAGWYKFDYSELAQSATSYAGLSINSAQLNVSVESANIADVGARIVKTSLGLTQLGDHLEALIRLNVGDFVVAHVTIGTYSAETNLTRISVEKILDI